MSIKAKLIGNEDERAVSPVIGVILMVAITVILAAVIAAFVLDLGGSISEEAQAGVNIEVDGDEVTATWTSQGNAEHINITNSSEEIGNMTSVGESITVSDQSGEQITATATTSEGTTTVVQTETVEAED